MGDEGCRVVVVVDFGVVGAKVRKGEEIDFTFSSGYRKSSQLTDTRTLRSPFSSLRNEFT
jgi:hypothetical protein